MEWQNQRRLELEKNDINLIGSGRDSLEERMCFDVIDTLRTGTCKSKKDEIELTDIQTRFR